MDSCSTGLHGLRERWLEFTGGELLLDDNPDHRERSAGSHFSRGKDSAAQGSHQNAIEAAAGGLPTYLLAN